MEQNLKKNVYCLYRVSTKGQVEKDDIPMQKLECHKFAESMGWTIVNEYSEKGISGFKVSAKKRDAILELQAEALKKKFDVLLVFMFDRLGRKEDETPFVVEWFAQQGIEVWSAKEGQQRFDNHSDKLMNYIRYWQAAGESMKTSVRTKTRLDQLAQEGKYRGGTPAFGYKIIKTGRINRKGDEVYDLAIDENEAAIVKLIFSKCVNEGFGSQRISSFLSKKGVTTRKGSNFTNGFIQNILKNRSYLGVIKNGDVESEIFSSLQIIDVKTFERCQEILRQRSAYYMNQVQENASVPLSTKGNHLLSGNIFCGHCGARLITTTSVRGHSYTEDGEKKVTRYRYACYNRTRHRELCDGQGSYTAYILDDIVDSVIRDFLGRIAAASRDEYISKQYAGHLKEQQACLVKAKNHLEERLRLRDDLDAEMIKVIRGQSAFTAERLERHLKDADAKAAEAQETVDRLAGQIKSSEEELRRLAEQYDDLVSWGTIYDECSLEAKKMIIANLIKAIRVSRGYQIEFEFKISYEQYRNPQFEAC